LIIRKPQPDGTAEEEQERNLALVAQAYEDYTRGVLPAGPGARELVEFFDTVDGRSPCAPSAQRS
jgi:hypothetical protein